MESSKSTLAFKLLASLVVCQIAGFIGAVFTTPSISTWYATLEKPALNPPNYLFGPVWTFLFIAMGVALFLIWARAKNDKEKKLAIILFFIQLFFNIMWSIVFFGLHSPLLAIFVIIILLVLIIATTIKFFRLSEAAGILMIPYILWVGFATILNIAIYFLNR